MEHINDQPDRVSSPSRLFADDTILYSLNICAQDPAALQEDLRKLEQWEKEWKMSFHPDKCNRLPITRSKKTSPQEVDYTLHGQILETVSSAKYLGVTLQFEFGRGTHIDNVCAKANRMLGFLRRNLKVCSVIIKELAYEALIQPHTPNIAFWHLPPNSARIGYATEGALFISTQISTDAVSALRKIWVLIRLWKQQLAPKHARKCETHLHRVRKKKIRKRKKSSVSIQPIFFFF